MRIEHDLLGEKTIPDDAYYGVQTARALENFHISGVPISQYPDLIRALAIVKMAAARANYECKQFSELILPAMQTVPALRAARHDAWQWMRRNWMLLVSIITRPPVGMASRALITRFMMTCSIWPGSATT